MAQFRKALPQLSGEFFLTDGGIETTLIFLERLELPDFAAFDLLKRKEGEAVLRKYFQTYSGLAQRFGTGLILESATWRASSDWGAKLGYSAKEMAEANRRAIALLEDIRNEFKGARKAVISGCVGPRGDGYDPGKTMSEKEAETYHVRQVRVFEDSAADMVTGIHMSHAELNESPELDIGDPAELGAQHAQLKKRLAQLNVMGGCCGTDHRHVEQIAAACSPLFAKAI